VPAHEQSKSTASLPTRPMRVLACLQANRAKIGDACNKLLVSHGQ
jgi:hypothetical protein